MISSELNNIFEDIWKRSVIDITLINISPIISWIYLFQKALQAKNVTHPACLLDRQFFDKLLFGQAKTSMKDLYFLDWKPYIFTIFWDMAEV